jgi:hypothetical protein
VKWTATASGGTAPYTYTWGGNVSGTGPSVNESYASPGTYNGKVTVTSANNQSVTEACTTNLKVNPPSGSTLPDLTAGSVSPLTATAGTKTTLSAPIQNIGTSTSGSFPSLLEVTSSTNVVQTGNLDLLAKGSGTASAPYTFPSAGAYKVRMCANFNSSWTNIVTESNYANNCGPWVTVTVTAPACTGSSCTCTGDSCGPGGGNPPAVSCRPSSSPVSAGQSVTWTATPSNFSGTVSYSWIASDGTPSSGHGSTFIDSYAADGSYSPTIVATDSSGDRATASCVPVTVGNGSECSTSGSGDIIANPNLVGVNNTGVSLYFSADGIPPGDTCTVTGPALTTTPVVTSPSSCDIATTTATTGHIVAQSIYTLTCTGWSGNAQAIVNIVPQFEEF